MVDLSCSVRNRKHHVMNVVIDILIQGAFKCSIDSALTDPAPNGWLPADSADEP